MNFYATAIRVNSLKLLHEHPELIKQAKDALKADGYSFKDLLPLKEIGHSLVCKVIGIVDPEDPDAEEEELYIVASPDGSYHFTRVVSYQSFYFTKEEVLAWRLAHYKALLAICKNDPVLSEAECLEAIVGLTDEHLAQVMPYNTPESYAEMVLM